MNNESSGCYVIDTDYNVINMNAIAKKLYPQLEVGKKCYTCLMELEEPCGPCPVARGIKGPKTYTDPIRKISEVVDAVDIEIEGHGLCHALIFSTVDQNAEFAASLPTSADELKTLALIKALTVDYVDVLSANIKDDRVTMYRLNGKALQADQVYKDYYSYQNGLDNYISKYILEEDREKLRKEWSLESLTETLKHSESVIYHYPVMYNGEIHYYFRKIGRIGDADNFENIVVGVGCEDEEVKNQQKQIALQNTLRKVETNTVTGLLNKEAFLVYSDKLLENHSDTEYDLSLLRISNLDAISRQYGNLAKEKVLQNVGETLKNYEDDKKCIAYLGDDIFACFIESAVGDQLKTIIHNFESEVIDRSDIKNIALKWTFYKNVDKTMSAEEIYNRAEHVRTVIFANSNKDYVEFDQQMLERMEWDISVESNFQNALNNREFIINLQPKYSVHSQQIVGAEALVRWKTRDGEIIYPDKFIPVLENCGLISMLDEEVFRQVCELQKKLADEGYPLMPISVNLSRASLFVRDIPQIYADIAAHYQVNPKLIPIEITESAAVRATMIREFADSLIKKGFVLLMDDFGAGYSSLASLQTIPFEGIKIDKSLVDFIGKQSGESLLKHTIAFAKESGMYIVAEGVEDFEQFMFLKVAGCDVIQGYYFSKPVSVDTFLSFKDIHN